MGERAVQLVILCRLFLFRFRLRRGNWQVTGRMHIDDSQFSQTSLVVFFFYLVFLILLNGGIRHVSQESIGLLEEGRRLIFGRGFLLARRKAVVAEFMEVHLNKVLAVLACTELRSKF